MFNFEELDDITRQYMLSEFRTEEASGDPYRSTLLSSAGLAAFPRAMGEAIQHGNEETLARALSDGTYWHPTETRFRSGKAYPARVNPVKAAERLALTEFNTWYVRGLARRLMEEGEQYCEVYRAAPAWEPRSECLQHEGAIYAVKEIYEGHRARYWPRPGNTKALSIPVGPYCHHSIRRVRS
jgi:hypothetical protein